MYMDVEDYSVLSDDAKHDIDQKMQGLLTDAYQRAATYLKEHERELHWLADALVEYETLSAEEIQLAIKGDGKLIAERRKAEADSTVPYQKREQAKDPSLSSKTKAASGQVVGAAAKGAVRAGRASRAEEE